MKVVPFHIPKHSEASIIYQEDIQESLYDNLHSHDETQITLIIEKGGTVFIGGYIEEYSEGDIYIIKGGVPHVFRSSDRSNADAHAISIFFDHRQFEVLETFKEFLPIKRFLDSCGKGAKITGDTQAKIPDFIKAMKDDGDFQRIIKLIVMIRMIYETSDFISFDNQNGRITGISIFFFFWKIKMKKTYVQFFFRDNHGKKLL